MARVYVNLTSNYNEYLKVLIGCALFVLVVLAVVFSLPFYLYLRSEHQKKAANQKAHYLATHDSLTGLVNRTKFDHLVNEAIATSGRQSGKCAIHFIDVDLFKEVNDTLGHDIGDELLKAFAKRLRAAIRSDDVVARIGGDEFAAFQKDVQDDTEAEAVAARITQAMQRPFEIFGQKVSVSASVGVAVASHNQCDPVELRKNADVALYWVKNHGRDSHKLFTGDLVEELIKRKAIEEAIRTALRDDLFELHFQPQLDRVNKTLVGFEALLRLRDKAGEFIPPMVFIPVAEDMGLIADIGHWVIRRATKVAAGWPETIGVAINLSSKEFSDDQLVDVIGSALEDSKLAPSRLEVEVTESLLLEDTSRNLETLNRIRELGVSIAIDDFGTGYSSLSYLWRFPFDKVKIDRSFLQATDANQSKSTMILETIVAMGHAMEMKVLAEGVETPEQVSKLEKMGCDEMQGYYLGRPMPERDIAAFVMSNLAELLGDQDDEPVLEELLVKELVAS